MVLRPWGCPETDGCGIQGLVQGLQRDGDLGFRVEGLRDFRLQGFGRAWARGIGCFATLWFEWSPRGSVSLPKGPKVVPFGDYLIEFLI